MSIAKNGRPAYGTVASVAPRTRYGMQAKQERGQNLRFTATLHVRVVFYPRGIRREDRQFLAHYGPEKRHIEF